MGGEEHASELMELVRASVPVVDVPWLSQVEKGEYLPLQVAMTQCTVPDIKKKRAERSRGGAEENAGGSKKLKVK